ncbi:MAG: hypothetical protein JNM27_10535 [Leptospirales bacterium]|nr:hypothetical protein [Leptospirales bacterium]
MNVISGKSVEEVQKIVDEALASNKVLSVQTYYLSDYGEKVLNLVTTAILNRFNRSDLIDIVYTSTKELVINATKSNLKRVLFTKIGLDLNNPENYQEGMVKFKDELKEENIRKYKELFREYKFTVTVTFYYSPDVLNIKIKNNTQLIPQEEERIREKFKKAVSYANLFDFYLEHGDDTEGAGMGLTLVGILLNQSGIDKHQFTLYSSPRFNETTARIEIPLTADYITRRDRFENGWKNSGMSREEYRQIFDDSAR